MDISELDAFKLSDAVKFHNKLNPDLWTNHKLDPEVRDQLLIIANDFVTTLGLSDLQVKDVTVSGSNAAYSYTPHSDLDLHIVVDFNTLPDNEVYQELFTAKKTIYNDSHDITVHGVPVEVYVQDVNEPVKSLGEYSVLHDKWIHIPKKKRANFDEAATKAKFDNLAELVELALKTQDLSKVEKTLDTIKRYRKAGLAKGGEFGPENLAFKAIRKQGGIQALYDLRNELRSNKLSIEEELYEWADSPYSYKKLPRDSGIKIEYEFTTDAGKLYHVAVAMHKKDIAVVNFKMMKQDDNGTEKLTGTGDSIKVMSTVVNIVKDAVAAWDYPKYIMFEATESEPSRVKLYAAMGRMAAKALPNYKLKSTKGSSSVKGKTGGYSVTTLVRTGPVNEDQLDETTNESQLINLISKKAAKEIFKMLRKKESALASLFAPDMKRHNLQTWGITPEKLGVPYVKDPVLGSVLNRVKFRAVDYVNPIHRKRIASYDPATHEITVHYPAIARIASNEQYETENYLAKIIAHELQHAVDEVKSKGKAFDTNKVAYSTLPYEINARFQEALMNMTMELDRFKKEGKTIDKRGLPDFIDSILTHNHISQFLPKDGRRYKQLVRRAYKFFEAELNNPKREQPLSIVKRAMNYILEKPTAEIHEASVKLYTDPNYFGAEVDDTNLKNLPTTNIPLDKLVSYEPDSKMNQEKAKTNVRKILQGLSKGENIPPILVRKYKNGYQVLDGHHRFYAYKLLKKKTIPAKIIPDEDIETVNEASGYIPSKKEANDPRFKTALTVDVKPDAIKKNAKAFGFKTSRAGIPPQANPNGKIAESLMNEWQSFLAESYDYSAWGYWIMPDGKILPVNYLSHDIAAKELGFDSKEDMVNAGAIRVTGARVSDVSSITRPSKQAIRGLVKLLRQVDRADNIWYANEETGEFKGVSPRELIQKLSGQHHAIEEDDQQELFPGYDAQHREKRLGDWLQNTHAWDGHKPMTFYHATTKDFDTFNTHGTGFASALGMAFEVERHGSFFAVDPMFAESFIEKPDYPGEYKEGGRVIPVHLSVQNPIDLRDNNLSYMLRDDETVDGFKANDIDLRSIYYHVPEFDRWELFDGPEGAEFVDNLQKLGFDGAIINESIPNNSNAKSGEVWVVFNPNQVKSIHNRGSFSPNDPNLMRENG